MIKQGGVKDNFCFLGHETVKTNVRAETSRPEWGDDGDSFTAPIDSDSMVISVK